MKIEGGFKVDADGRTRGTYSHNPSSLRLSMHDPNLTQIPRATDEISTYVKDVFVCPPGHLFHARDYSGIEAVLVGYFAGSQRYTRLARIDVHSFYTAHALHILENRISTSELPQLSYSDADLAACLGDIKKRFKIERNELYKHLIHGANFLQGAKGAQETILKQVNKGFNVKLIQKLMDVYFELFPEIRKWHNTITKEVDGTKRRQAIDGETIDDAWTLGVCYAQNPFGYTHHFYNVLDWKKVDGKWYSSFGEDAKRLVSFLPQSTAAAILKRAAKCIWNIYPWVGEDLRLMIHDELFFESLKGKVDEWQEIIRAVMEEPIQELPLDPSWGMGESLTILTEGKQGPTWSTMQ